MAQIKVRGLGKVYAPDSVGEQIKRDFINKTLPDMVEINERTVVRGKDIDGVMLEGEALIKDTYPPEPPDLTPEEKVFVDKRIAEISEMMKKFKD